MRLEDLKAAKSRRPFQPFLILMADGRVIPVMQPEAFGLPGERAQTVICMVPSGGSNMIEVAEIKSLRFVAPERPRSPLIDRIRHAMHAQPERPLHILVDDGTLHTVEQAEHIAISPGDRRPTIAFYTRNDRNPGGYDHHYVSEDQVLDVIVSEESSPSGPGPVERDRA